MSKPFALVKLEDWGVNLSSTFPTHNQLRDITRAVEHLEELIGYTLAERIKKQIDSHPHDIAIANIEGYLQFVVEHVANAVKTDYTCIQTITFNDDSVAIDCHGEVTKIPTPPEHIEYMRLVAKSIKNGVVDVDAILEEVLKQRKSLQAAINALTDLRDLLFVDYHSASGDIKLLNDPTRVFVFNPQPRTQY